VIPRWAAAMLGEQPIVIYGDGVTTRDFCYVANVVQANLLAATVAHPSAVGEVYNVAFGGRTSLNELHATLRELVLARHPALAIPPAVHEAFRAGDVRHSQADIGKARSRLGYEPTHDTHVGLAATLPWYEQLVAAAETAAPAERRAIGAA
jgi:UDP-N-acetylglucosamine 4-epimerase